MADDESEPVTVSLESTKMKDKSLENQKELPTEEQRSGESAEKLYVLAKSSSFFKSTPTQNWAFITQRLTH